MLHSARTDFGNIHDFGIMPRQVFITVPLHAMAHGRAGDKGDIANISVIAFCPEFFPILAEQVTGMKVRELFRHRSPSEVRRYLLPKLSAINFVLEGALDGGVNESLHLDAHGKTLSFLLLGLKIEVPAELATRLRSSQSLVEPCLPC
jgi:hypothetical protein